MTYKIILYNKEEITAELADVEVVMHRIGQIEGYGVSLSSYEDADCKST